MSPIKQLTFSYISMFALLGVLLLASQVLTSVAHTQATHARSVVTTLNDQVLRTQRMFYHVLLLQSPSDPKSPIDYLAINALVQADDPAWESAQAGLGSEQQTGPGTFGFSSSGLLTLAASQKAFAQMEAAYHAIFLMERDAKPATPDSVRPYVDTIYVNEENYVQDLVSLSSDLTRQANLYSEHVYDINLAFSSLCLAVVIIEALFIARPAGGAIKKQIDELTKGGTAV